VNDAMCGATYIDVADCFRIHEQIFKRDAKDDVDVKSLKLSLVFAHSGGNCTSILYLPVVLHLLLIFIYILYFLLLILFYCMINIKYLVRTTISLHIIYLLY